MYLTSDAVLWKMPSDLLPLVNKSRVLDVLRMKYDYKRNPHRRAGIPYFNTAVLNEPYCTTSGHLVPEVKLLSIFGELAYHVDPLYPPFNYHLLLRSRNYMTVGESRPEVFKEDTPGMLMGLCTHRRHAVYHRKNRLSRELKDVYLQKPRNMWASLCIDSWARLEQGQVYDMFRYLLTYDGYSQLRDLNQ